MYALTAYVHLFIDKLCDFHFANAKYTFFKHTKRNLKDEIEIEALGAPGGSVG